MFWLARCQLKVQQLAAGVTGKIKERGSGAERGGPSPEESRARGDVNGPIYRESAYWCKEREESGGEKDQTGSG